MRSTQELCRTLQVKPHQIEYLLAQGRIPRPSTMIAGVRLYSDEEFETIRAYVVAHGISGRGKNWRVRAEERSPV